jgi:hypothetical protein
MPTHYRRKVTLPISRRLSRRFTRETAQMVNVGQLWLLAFQVSGDAFS